MFIEIGFGIMCLALIICCVMFKSERDVAICERDLLMKIGELKAHQLSERVKTLAGVRRSHAAGD